jgi:hypothetical protein
MSSYFLKSQISDAPFCLNLLEDWLLSLMSTLVMGFGPQDKENAHADTTPMDG